MPDAPDHGAFSERDFYLAEFRGRTIAVAAPREVLAAIEPVAAVLKELASNRTRVVLLSDSHELLEGLSGGPSLAPTLARFEGEVWRALRERACVGIEVEGGDELLGRASGVALRLAVAKLVWLDRVGGLERARGERRSFVANEELPSLIDAVGGPRRRLLVEIQTALRAGLPAVNVCTPDGLADELFTYAGSGTLFTRDRYISVRKLGIDDYDTAAHLIARGVSEGFLAPREPEAIDAILASALGAFVEGTHLAGIGALVEFADEGAAEIASLYTLTRFVGEGVGAHLVAAALERARDRGFGYVFACTTSDRVVDFFERNGFVAVTPSDVPAAKWATYDPERRARVRCVRRDLR